MSELSPESAGSITITPESPLVISQTGLLEFVTIQYANGGTLTASASASINAQSLIAEGNATIETANGVYLAITVGQIIGTLTVETAAGSTVAIVYDLLDGTIREEGTGSFIVKSRSIV